MRLHLIPGRLLNTVPVVLGSIHEVTTYQLSTDGAEPSGESAAARGVAVTDGHVHDKFITPCIIAMYTGRGTISAMAGRPDVPQCARA